MSYNTCVEFADALAKRLGTLVGCSSPAQQRPPLWHFLRQDRGIDHNHGEQSMSSRRQI